MKDSGQSLQRRLVQERDQGQKDRDQHILDTYKVRYDHGLSYIGLNDLYHVSSVGKTLMAMFGEMGGRVST